MYCFGPGVRTAKLECVATTIAEGDQERIFFKTMYDYSVLEGGATESTYMMSINAAQTTSPVNTGI